jgi:hypothetical protein
MQGSSIGAIGTLIPRAGGLRRKIPSGSPAGSTCTGLLPVILSISLTPLGYVRLLTTMTGQNAAAAQSR